MQRASANDVSRQLWSEDRRRELVRLAAARIRDDYDDDSWNAFWRTHVEGEPIAEVANQLGKSTGAIYAVRSRIVRRLRGEVEEIESMESKL